jgi:hypothetical protein
VKRGFSTNRFESNQTLIFGFKFQLILQDRSVPAHNAMKNARQPPGQRVKKQVHNKRSIENDSMSLAPYLSPSEMKDGINE